ncbi:transposase [Parafrankia elaeagni]|uniref:transposase n=1 Tax=Parafrankia elaeagni TaxID=222534 RepID=UPI000369CF1C|nr:transposase [Parafrankia elaeagni]
MAATPSFHLDVEADLVFFEARRFRAPSTAQQPADSAQEQIAVIRPTRYPPPFRARAIAYVAHIRDDHRSTWQAIKTVSAALGVSTETLRRWVRHADTAPDRQGQTRRQHADLRHLQEQNTRLRRELHLLRTTGTSPAPHLAADPTTQATPPAPAPTPPQPTRVRRPGPTVTIPEQQPAEPPAVSIPRPATPQTAGDSQT